MATRDVEDFKANRLISFITFNYDRSLDYFLRNSVMGLFNLGDEDAKKLLGNIQLIHLHGQLGELTPSGNGGRPYEPTKNYETMKMAMDGIRIIHEGQDDSVFFRAQELISDAETVLLLGFGYHDMNIRRLKMKDYAMYGTTLGLTPAEVLEVKARLPNLQPRTETAYNFLRNTAMGKHFNV